MTIHLHHSIELSAPLATVRALLEQHPPFGGTRIQQWWRWQAELWCIHQHTFADDRLVWHGHAPAIKGSQFVLTTHLHDAHIATHVQLHWALTLPGAAWNWWERARQQRTLVAEIDATLRCLKEQIAALAPAPHALADLPSQPATLADALRATHPQTVAAFQAMDAVDSLAAVARLDARWQANEQGAAPPAVHQVVDQLPPVTESYDLIYAGGGLGLLHAVVMAKCYGYRVLLFDRGEVGCAHREWNIGEHELQALIDVGVCTGADLERIVMRRYRDGLVRYWPDHSPVQPAELHLPDVLNVGIDAAALLQLARRKLEAAGGTVLDRRAFERVLAQPNGNVVVEVIADDGTHECYGARLLLDGMGATSPLAQQRYAGRPFAGVCPTVGSVVRGLEEGPALDQHHPDIGDILISVADTQRDRQLIWEGFAGRDDELTVYMFYYDVIDVQRSSIQQVPDVERSQHSLLDLFEDYFALLPTYKRPGPHFRHVRPVYGFIPARHTQRRDTRPPLLGTLPIGDSSAQQSPLTFCGFGSHVRNLGRTTSLLDLALRHDLRQPQHLRHISAYQANVALHWVFSRFMQPWRAPNDVNLLQNVFARVLNDLGVDVATRFFQDQMRWRDYGHIVNHTLHVYKRIIPTSLAVLGPRDTARWVADWLRFSGAAAVAAVGRRAGAARLDRWEEQAWMVNPAWGFALRARRAEWQAMGWNT